MPPKPPEPPSPPGLLDSPDESQKRNFPEFFEDIGISPQAFGEVALNSPVPWTGEQLDQLQMLVEGDWKDLEEGALEELLHELNANRPPQPKQQPKPKETEEDLGIDGIGGGVPYTPPTPVPLEVPTCRVNLDDWLKKSKPE